MRKSQPLSRLPQWRPRLLPSRFSRSTPRNLRQTSTSTPPPPNGPSPARAPPSFERILHRTPRFLRPTLSALHSAPLTHVTAFLILHELTAIIPLFGLAGAFHYYNWLPPFFAEGKWVVSGVEKFGSWFKKRGWIKEGEKTSLEADVGEDGKGTMKVEKRETRKSTVFKWWNRGEGGVRWVVEFATAYAVVKALLPLRIVLSVWGAPWFARWTVVPLRDGVKRMLGFGAKASTAAGTGAKIP